MAYFNNQIRSDATGNYSIQTLPHTGYYVDIYPPASSGFNALSITPFDISTNILTNIIGSVLKIGVTGMVAKNGEQIKAAVGGLVKKLLPKSSDSLSTY